MTKVDFGILQGVLNEFWAVPHSDHRNIEKSGAYREAKIIEIHAKLIQLVGAVNQVILMPIITKVDFGMPARGFERRSGTIQNPLWL